MSKGERIFAGSIPELYDRLMVPLIFEPYAVDLTERVAALSPHAVLETAAGTGVVTRMIARRLESDMRYVASDLSQPMLDRAAARQKDDARITWRVADALDLPFDDDAFDVVICQFGVMFFPDKIKAYREARRVLRPGGHFIFSVWAGLEENDFARTVNEALVLVFPGDPPSFMARLPHGYHDLDLIRRQVLEAGFGTVTITSVAAVSRAETALAVATAFCQGTPVRGEIEDRDPQSLESATAAAAERVAVMHPRDGAFGLTGRLRAHVCDCLA